MIRCWDRSKAEFVEIPVQRSPDCTLSCKDCRYFDEESESCLGVGFSYYQRKVPFPEFVARNSECEVRLPPDLFSFV
ncbi:hypothetical protein EU527_11540 [Candidatus Thorarchaeota archaeon]|nr:MAG: hypothetical protein EU527_11540 [Candidatus Thorarchaeota archaeon]